MVKHKVLFVCLGNICRSPAAEGYFNYLLEKADLSESYLVDSAGTSAYHVGEPADGRMQDAARNRGYSLHSVSRAFDHINDFINFDYIFTMDHLNYQDVSDLSPNRKSLNKIFKLTDFCKIHSVHQVPDPYYKKIDGFELCLDIIEDACDELFKQLEGGALNA